MGEPPTTRRAAALVLLLVSLLVVYQNARSPSLRRAIPFWRISKPWASIYVVHLPARRDRWQRMESLASALHLDLTYHDATPASSRTTSILMEHVRREREAEGWCLDRLACVIQSNRTDHRYVTPLSPSVSVQVIDQGLEHGWQDTSVFLPDAYLPEPDSLPYEPNEADLWALHDLQAVRQVPIPVMTETTTNDVLRDKRRLAFDSYETYNQRKRFDGNMTVRVLPLARSEVSCWKSHTDVLLRFIESGQPSTLVVEDDVDMEWDLEERVQELWSVMPSSYDVVFLGHCWSHEDVFPPVNARVPTLRPAHTPKCTHGYALSRKGAVKLMRHLRSPGFAYSMPLDRALTHLIATQRIEAYSAFPPLIVQTLDSPSDIQPDARKIWKDQCVRARRWVPS